MVLSVLLSQIFLDMICTSGICELHVLLQFLMHIRQIISRNVALLENEECLGT